jgi:hypothetical protein
MGVGTRRSVLTVVQFVAIVAALVHDLVSGRATKLIIDTDMDLDVDDVGALCMAHALQDNGEAEIAAVVYNSGIPSGVGAISVINHFYGRDEIPIGSFKGTFANHTYGKYNHDLVSSFPSPIKNYTQTPDAVTVYRAALAKAPPQSVSIASIGFMQNLAGLLDSKADHISTLSGYELVQEKVQLLAVMGGAYPSSHKSPEFNFNCGDKLMGSPFECRGKSNETIEKMPKSVRVVFVGWELGVKVLVGAKLTQCAPSSNPCRRAFIDFLGENADRASWDLLTTLYAVRHNATAMNCSEAGSGGRNFVNSTDNNNRWVNGTRGYHQRYLVLNPVDFSGAGVGAHIDDLLCQAPKRRP